MSSFVGAVKQKANKTKVASDIWECVMAEEVHNVCKSKDYQYT